MPGVAKAATSSAEAVTAPVRHGVPDGGGRRRRGLALVFGLLPVLVVTALFRATQNMGQTTLALLGKERLGISASSIGWVGAAVGLVSVAVAMLGASRVPVRLALLAASASALVLSVSLLVFALAGSFAMFVGAAVIFGLASGIGLPSLTTNVGARPGPNRDRSLALFTLALSASLALGPLLETAVLSVAKENVRVPFVVFAGFPVLAALIGFGSWRSGGGRLGHPLRRDQEDATAPEGASGSVELEEAQAGEPPREGVQVEPARPLWSILGWRAALWVQLVYSIPFSGIVIFGALVARVGYGVTPAVAQLAFTSLFVTSMAGRAYLAWRPIRGSKAPAIALSVGLSVVGLVLLALGHGVVALMAAMALLGIPHGITFPVVLSLVAGSTTPAELPKANAVLLGGTSLTSVVIPAALGVIIAAFGYRDMVLFLLAPVVVISVALWSSRSALTMARPS